MGGPTPLSLLTSDGAEIILSLILALVLAWVVGVWLGERFSRLVHGGARPRQTIGRLMSVVLVVALVLALMLGDPRVLLYAIVLIPCIAMFQYIYRH